MYTLKEIESYAHKCRRCPLHKTRTKLVFGAGNPKADILFVGEAPGFYEDKSGQVFVGKSGQLLDKMLASIDLKREDIYIANIIKCRPPDNRSPTEEESTSCIEFLRWQVKIIQPKIIVCLGAVAAKNIISPDFRVSRQRGVWISRGSYSIIASYHPSALLRDESKKTEAWEDLKKIRQKLDE
ncbi:MAG TPA: uracil-DNA glycosylase [Clostridia bacterium]|nr:uracil-DNA glycosylase [Clostridia bacterium]